MAALEQVPHTVAGLARVHDFRPTTERLRIQCPMWLNGTTIHARSQLSPNFVANSGGSKPGKLGETGDFQVDLIEENLLETRYPR
jgi:hypothetical protein